MTSHQQAIEALARVLHSLSPDALYSGLFHGDAETIIADTCAFHSGAGYKGIHEIASAAIANMKGK